MEDGLEFDPHPEMLRKVTTMTLITMRGPLDLCFIPGGFAAGYDALRARAVVITVADTEMPVASLADVIASKRAAGRARTGWTQRARRRLRRSWCCALPRSRSRVLRPGIRPRVPIA
jgi:hypothetical protein